MRHFFTIFWHEVRMLLLSPGTYIAAVLFLGLMGFIFTFILQDYTAAAQGDSPAVQFFRVFWIPAWVIVPLLTMKSLAEERRSGTLESLLTTPVKASEVVLAKYGASYLFYVFLWFSTAGFLFILHRFAKDARFLDTGPLIGGYAFIAVTSLFYVAIGILASALTRSQAVAGILAFVTLAGVTLGPLGLNRYALPQQTALQPLQNALGSIDVWQHLDDFTRGVVDTRQIVFYCTATALALILSILSVEGKILRS